MLLRIPKIHKSVFTFSTQIEEHKPTPIQKRVQQEGIMAKKLLEHKYELINSSPLDGKELIQEKFIVLKRKLNDRFLYIPNKKQYLKMLDEAYDEIMEKHEDYTIPEYAPPRGRITKKQQVQYQLEKLKKAKIFELLQTYEVAFLMLMILACGYIIAEEVGEIGNPRVTLSQYFAFSKFLAQKKREMVLKIKETFALPTEAQKQGALKRFLDERKMLKQSLGQQKTDQ